MHIKTIFDTRNIILMDKVYEQARSRSLLIDLYTPARKSSSVWPINKIKTTYIRHVRDHNKIYIWRYLFKSNLMEYKCECRFFYKLKFYEFESVNIHLHPHLNLFY